MPSLQIPEFASSIPPMTSDEILNHARTVYDGLPDPVKGALDHAHGLLGGAPGSSVADAVAPPPVIPGRPTMDFLPGVDDQKTATVDQLELGPPSPRIDVGQFDIELGGTGSGAGSAVDPALIGRDSEQFTPMDTGPMPPMSASRGELARLTRPPLMSGDPNAHTKQDTGRPGFDQIKNPLLRGLATAGDVVLSGILPNFGRFIPGTTAYHDERVGDASGAVNREQATAKGDADVAHTQAQSHLAEAQAAGLPAESKMHEAQAQNYISESEARKNPSLKPLPEPVIDPNDPTKTPRIGYHDEKDPTGKVIYGPVVGAKPVAAHQPTNEIEAFLQAPENKGKPIAGVLKDFWEQKAKATGEGKLLTPETASTLNSVWNTLAPKYHLAMDPFRQGMSDSETKHVQDSMNAAISREQGGQHIVIQQQNADSAGKKAQSKEVSDAVKPIVSDLNKQFGLAHDQAETAKDAIDALNGGAIGQALATIKSIVAVAGGKGSGVRITQAEINSIAKATGWAGSFENFINSAKGDGKLNATQQKQLTDILNGIRQKAAEKGQMLDATINKLESADSKEEVHKIHSEYRNQVMGTAGGTPRFKEGDTQVKDGVTYVRDKSGNWNPK